MSAATGARARASRYRYAHAPAWACDPRRLRAGGGDIGRGRRPRRRPLPGARACPIFPASNVWNRPVNAPAGRGQLGRHDQRDRGGRNRAPRLRVVPRLRHPVHGRLREEHAQGEGVVRVRGRVRSRRLPDPRAPQPGGSGDGHILLVDKDACRLYELFDASGQRRRLEGRLGRRLEPALQPPAPQRLDVGRRRRAADPARPRALRRGRRRRDPPRPALHRRAHRARPTSTRRATTRAIRRSVAAADGPARPAQGLGRHLRLRQAGARRAPRRSRPTG